MHAQLLDIKFKMILFTFGVLLPLEYNIDYTVNRRYEDQRSEFHSKKKKEEIHLDYINKRVIKDVWTHTYVQK